MYNWGRGEAFLSHRFELSAKILVRYDICLTSGGFGLAGT